MKMANSIELFTGAGGLAIGLESAGCYHVAMVESNGTACDTLRFNANKRKGDAKNRIFQRDARTMDYSAIGESIDMVAGGPPCQPFSMGGKAKGYEDSKDMFPEAVRAVREIRPKCFLFENVKGLLRQSFSSYFNYIILQLTYPCVVKRKGEGWVDHLSRLEK
ncbi:MAG: DNA cytosine methyltransferase [Planctomycetia bacterium]|nr:DNA cytosine methyltransferase [Planctomycetia bacterium]